MRTRSPRRPRTVGPEPTSTARSPGHVRQNEGHQAGLRLAAETSALDRRERGAQAVDRRDVRARPRQRADPNPLRRESQARARQGEHRRGASGHEAQHDVAAPEGAEEPDRAARRAHARRIRLRVRAADHRAARQIQAAHRVPARQHHQRGRRGPVRERGPRHSGSRLPCGEHTDAPPGREHPAQRRRGERPRDGRFGIGAGKGRPEEPGEDPTWSRRGHGSSRLRLFRV